MKWRDLAKAIMFFSSPIIVGVALTETAQLYAHRQSNIEVGQAGADRILLMTIAQAIQRKREELLHSGRLNESAPEQIVQAVSGSDSVEWIGNRGLSTAAEEKGE
jgi:hypothetical protein